MYILLSGHVFFIQFTDLHFKCTSIIRFLGSCREFIPYSGANIIRWMFVYVWEPVWHFKVYFISTPSVSKYLTPILLIINYLEIWHTLYLSGSIHTYIHDTCFLAYILLDRLLHRCIHIQMAWNNLQLKFQHAESVLVNHWYIDQFPFALQTFFTIKAKTHWAMRRKLSSKWNNYTILEWHIIPLAKVISYVWCSHWAMILSSKMVTLE